MKSLNSQLNIVYGRILYKFPLESNEDLFNSFNFIENFPLKKDLTILEKNLYKIKNLLSKDEDIKKYFFWKIGLLGAKIYQLKEYLLASKIYKLAIDIIGEDTNKQWIFSKISKEYELVALLSKDNSIKDLLKYPLYTYNNTLKHDYYLATINDELFSLTSKELKKRIKSINKIKKNYYEIYLYKKDFYKNIENLYNNQIKYLNLKNKVTINKLFKNLFK